jgi:hypothetical protein
MQVGDLDGELVRVAVGDARDRARVTSHRTKRRLMTTETDKALVLRRRAGGRSVPRSGTPNWLDAARVARVVG